MDWIEIGLTVATILVSLAGIGVTLWQVRSKIAAPARDRERRQQDAAAAVESRPVVTPVQIGLAGTFGGMLPSLLYLAIRFREAEDGLLGFTAISGELVAMGLFGLMGCGCAIFLSDYKETTMKKAFVIGIGVPALILLIMTWVVEPLSAASQPPETRSLTVHTVIPISGSIYIRDSSSSSEREIARNDDGSWTVPASEFRLVYRGVIAAPAQTPVETPVAVIDSGTEPIELHLDPRQTFLGGFLDGLGLDNIGRQHVFVDATLQVAGR